LAAIVNLEDFRLLQAAKARQEAGSLRETITNLRARTQPPAAGQLEALIEEARAEFYQLQCSQAEGG
jgi:hypothetical protein